jgi:hypothetical protein
MACLFVSSKVEDTIKKLKDIMIATYIFRHPNVIDWDTESKVRRQHVLATRSGCDNNELNGLSPPNHLKLSPVHCAMFRKEKSNGNECFCTRRWFWSLFASTLGLSILTITSLSLSSLCKVSADISICRSFAISIVTESVSGLIGALRKLHSLLGSKQLARQAWDIARDR